MTTSTMPTTGARRQTVKASALAVEHRLVSKGELAAVLKSPVMSPKDRKAAKGLIASVRARAVELKAGAGAKSAIERLASSLEVETTGADRMQTARDAFAAGAIDDDLFRLLTMETSGVRAAFITGKLFSQSGRDVTAAKIALARAEPGASDVLTAKLLTAEAKHAILGKLVGQLGGEESIRSANGRMNTIAAASTWGYPTAIAVSMAVAGVVTDDMATSTAATTAWLGPAAAMVPAAFLDQGKFAKLRDAIAYLSQTV